jgi:hypothetical protein
MPPKSLTMVDGSDQSTPPDTGVTILSLTIDDDDVRFDQAALHGLSVMERRYAFVDAPADLPDTRDMFVVWVGIRAGFDGTDGYFSVVASPIKAYAATQSAFRPDTHFTDMIYAIQGSLRLEGLTGNQKRLLRDALRTFDDSMWSNKSEMFRRVWPD